MENMQHQLLAYASPYLQYLHYFEDRLFLLFRLNLTICINFLIYYSLKHSIPLRFAPRCEFVISNFLKNTTIYTSINKAFNDRIGTTESVPDSEQLKHTRMYS